MAPLIKGSASYKKKPGALGVSKDGQTVSWVPAATSTESAFVLNVSKITSEGEIHLSLKRTYKMFL